MKTIHLRKLSAIMEVKTKALFSKNFVIMPLFTIGFTFVFKLVYGSIGASEAVNTAVLSLGVVMNICMTGVYCIAATLAEEKEKHTLRTLMTSSVNGMEFFLGSLLPVVAMMMVIHGILPLIVDVGMNAAQWGSYLIITTLASVCGCMIGMIVGIFAKNQVSASTLSTPAILIFMMIPMFSQFHPFIETISKFLFTGVASHVVQNMTGSLDMMDVGVLVVEIVLSTLLFVMLYRKNGFEA